MSIHDHAHKLARELANSSEYKELLKAREKIKDDPKTLEMVKDFRSKQFELQASQLTGQEDMKEKEEALEKLYGVISSNSAAREVLEAEYKFNKLYTDIQNILNESIKDSMEW